MKKLQLLAFALMALALVLLPACGSSRPKDEPAGCGCGCGDAPADADACGENALQDVEKQMELDKQFHSVMYRRLFAQARQLMKGMQLHQALDLVNEALNHNAASEEALNLRSDIQRMLGDRAGEVRTVIDDQWRAHKVKLDEQKVAVRGFLGDADAAMAVRRWDDARRAYENANFIVSTSRLAPLGGDSELQELGQKSQTGLHELERIIAKATAERERADTERAIQRVAEQEERALLEARDRRARLLVNAIDAFNLERFALAESYAQQVIAEEPDNTVAKDILNHSREARHRFVNETLLQEMKDSFRNWLIDIEETKIPSSSILKWPSQSFWDKITRIRRIQSTVGGGAEMTAEEQNVANTLRARQIDLRFDATAFPQVVNYLTAASGVNFIIDARAKEDLEAAEISIQASNVTVRDALDLIMMQASAEGEVIFQITGNIVRFIKKENVKTRKVLRIHPVADLTLGLTDFIPPQITLVGVDEDSETPLFGGQAEEAPQPYGTIEELMELVRGSVEPESWDDAQINAQGKNLVVYNTAEVQNKVAEFLDDLRSFAGLVITIEARFLTVTDVFLRDVGVDFRGLGGTNGGPLAVLDDVTSGLDDNASAALDNSGPGVDAGGAALAPSSGLFFNDGTDGDFRGRSENIFTNPLGQMLSALGGGTFQVTFLDDFSLSMILRATEKNIRLREMTAPSLTVYNTQRANLTVVNQISYVQDFDVEVAQTAFIADPVIGVIQDGLTLDVRPTVSNDRQYITLELRPTVVNLITPIATFQTLLGAATLGVVAAQNPVTIQLPEVDIQVAESTVRIPDRGSILLGGLKSINIEDRKSTSPVMGSIPILSFLFTRHGKAEEIEHLMIVVTATITDLQEQAGGLRG